MDVRRFDHFVLTVRDIQRTVDFYTTVMGMEEVEFAGGRKSLKFGEQKINLHLLGHEFEPKAKHVRAGSADLCFIIGTPVEEAIEQLKAKGVEIIDGPVIRAGAIGRIVSVYFRDPDGNLIEVSNYLSLSVTCRH